MFSIYRSLTSFRIFLFFSSFRIFLSLWTLHYSKTDLDFYPSSQGYRLWVLASLFSAKVRTRRRREKYRETRNCLSVKSLSWGVYMRKKKKKSGQEKVKLIHVQGQESLLSNREREPCLRVPGRTQTHSPIDQDTDGGPCRNMWTIIGQTPLELAHCILSHQRTHSPW